MLTKFFPRSVRRYAYGVIEVLSAIIFSVGFSVVFVHQEYRMSQPDPGMAQITGACFMAVSAAIFILVMCVKRLDNDD